MFSWYKYLIVDLVFSHLGFWSGNLFLIAPFLIFAYLYLFTKYLALIDQAVSEEMFEYYGNIHVLVYCPGVGAYKPLGSHFSE